MSVLTDTEYRGQASFIGEFCNCSQAFAMSETPQRMAQFHVHPRSGFVSAVTGGLVH